MRRFCAINVSLVRDARGSWARGRDKALAVLRGGHRGQRVIYFDVSGYSHGGYNMYPESLVCLARIDDDPHASSP